MDFLITITLGILVYHFFPDQSTWLTAAIPATNGLLAMNMTKLWNSRLPKMQPTT